MAHHPRKYMAMHGVTVTYVFSCCGKIREFLIQDQRDKVAKLHAKVYAEHHQEN